MRRCAYETMYICEFITKSYKIYRLKKFFLDRVITLTLFGNIDIISKLFETAEARSALEKKLIFRQKNL